ncbi:MAG TPA: hypothetical protein VJT10_23665 [Steroidobacteraceae bacterium]|nr:hypothetical protein [Steroidobacteraceae bacterium]
MIRRLLLSVLLAAALAACGRGGAATDLEGSLDAPSQLAPGQSLVLEAEKLEVQFVGIATDSRCPADVTCVWAGEVVARLAIRSDGKTTQHEVKENESATADGFTVTVLQVLPARSSSQPIAAADYRATLKITR